MAAKAEDFTGTSSRPKSVAELVAAFDSRATRQKMRSPTRTTIQSSLPRPPLINQTASVSGRRIGHGTSTEGSHGGIPVQKELLSNKVQPNPLQQQNKRQPKEAKASTAMKRVSCASPQRKGITLKDVTNSMRNDNISQKSASVPAKKTYTKLNQKAIATIASRRKNRAAKEKTQPETGKDLKSTIITDMDDFESSIEVTLLDTQRHEHDFAYDNTPDSSFGTDVGVIAEEMIALTAQYMNVRDSESDCSTHNTENESSFFWRQQLFGSFRLPSVTAMVESTITTPQTKNTGRNHDYYDDDDDDDDDFVAEPRYNIFPSMSNRMERDKAIGSDHRNNVSRSESFFACFDFDEIRHAIRETVL
jgi:hypothetical protein